MSNQKKTEQAEKLAAFKTYVHKRLDDAGVPTDPESSHKAEGCRIGGRLDIVLARYAVVPEMLSALRTAEDALRWYGYAANALEEIRAAIAKAEAEGAAK